MGEQCVEIFRLEQDKLFERYLKTDIKKQHFFIAETCFHYRNKNFNKTLKFKSTTLPTDSTLTKQKHYWTTRPLEIGVVFYVGV